MPQYRDDSPWQLLVTTAYKRWNLHGRVWKYGKFLDTLTKVEQDAVLLASLNYQTENGGFAQWVDNAYGLWATETLSALRKIRSGASEAVISILNEFVHNVDESLREAGYCDYWLEEPDWNFLHELSERYYEVQDKFVADVEDYFAANAARTES